MIFSSILDSAEALTLANGVICTGASLLLGLMIAATYMFNGKYTKNFVITLALMPVLVQTIIMMVSGNLGTGVAVMGAFSLVRFRSVPGSSREIFGIFFAMAIGLATGMGYIGFACVLTLILAITWTILTKTPFGEKDSGEKELKITIPEDLNYTTVFDDIFEEYAKKVSLNRVKTTNLGSMFELAYSIQLKDPAREKELIDEIRCRNGNLTIICSKAATVSGEL